MKDSMDVLLGRGGQIPGLGAYDESSGQVVEILGLPRGNSVYAVARSPDGKIVAIGTRTGDLYWLTRSGADGQDDNWLVRRFANGAPILSVCFVDSLTLAVADAVGRCLLLPFTDGTHPDRLPAGPGVICALVRLDGDQVVGLSASDAFVVWNWREKRVVKVLDGPAPPDASALVAPAYWPAADMWVWPGRDGLIVLCDWRQGRLRTARGHTGEVYAIAVCDEELLTIGRTDGRLKRWQVDSADPVAECEAPPGIVSVALWGDRTFEALLIDEVGRAGIYSWDGSSLAFKRWLPGQDYRIAVGLGLGEYRSAVRQRKTLRAQELAVQAQETVARCQWDEIELLCKQFTELGFEHMALALYAEEARGKADLVAELQAYNKLVEILPPGHGGARASLEQYAALLEAVWQPQRALYLYQQLLEMDPSNSSYRTGVQRACDHARVIAAGNCVIETDVPLAVLVRAAATLGEAFAGRYRIREIERPIPCQVRIPVGEFVQRYEQIRQARPQTPLPPADQREISWLSRKGADKVTTVLFADQESGGVGSVEFGIKFFDAGLQTVLAPVIVLNAGTYQHSVSVEQQNEAVLDRVQRIENGSLSTDGWLQIVHRAANFAIRQLINKGRAGRDRPW